MTRVYLGLGSNLGDRYGRLIDALEGLRSYLAVDSISSIYETEPWGYADQPRFLNAVCSGETDLPPQELLSAVKTIELLGGREPSFRYGPRAIDIDILLYGEVVIDQENFAIPHAQLHERDFVLAPLTEIAPAAVHPKFEKTIEALSAALDLSQVRVFAKRPLHVGSSWWCWGHQTYVMGILNVTPDSFSGDGLLKKEDWLAAVVDQGQEMLAAGAHILDVGGESTRPGSEPVTADEELDRVVPAIRALSEAGLGPISIDTYKAVVAHAALEAGAVMVNDVWGLRRDLDMADLIAERGVPAILMHNRSKSQDAAFEARLGGRYTGSQYADLIPDVQRELQECVDIACNAGISDWKIILDPGIGFGKTISQNLELLDRVGEFKTLGFPILIGPSRKSFIGYTLNLPPAQRVEGTAAAVAIGIARGADIVRVHDVDMMARVAQMTDAIVRRKEK
ncbi:MAG TPA: dihydropteroate synthase [Anaerolineae bacterium]|nr:dihydropteroate synthase [Anaerolineae bacterium]